MAHKIGLSKLKKKQDASYASSLAFRFIPHEEDLEEIPSDASEPLMDRDVPGEGAHPDPIAQNLLNQKPEQLEHPNPHDKDKTIVQASPFDPPRIGTRQQGSVSESDAYRHPNRKKPVERAKSATFPDSQLKTSDVDVASMGVNNLEGRGSSDSSPMKESVKDLMTKLSKRSASFDCSSQILESDAWSLISGIKGKIAKTWEERRNRDISSGSLSNSSKCSDKRDSDRISVDSLDLENSTPSSESTAAAVSDYTPEAEEGCSAEIFFQTSESWDQNGTTTTNTSLSQGSPTKQAKFNNSVDVFGQAKEARQASRIPVSMTLSSLMATKSLEMDIMEEDESVSPPPSATCKVAAPSVEEEVVRPAPVENTLSSEKQPSIKKQVLRFKEKCLQWWSVCVEQSQRLLKRKVAVTGVAFLACVVAPLPSFISGFLMGFMFSALLASLCWCLFRPPQRAASGGLSNPDRVMPRLFEIPRNIHRKDSTVIHKGWMNQLPFEYNPDTYHINMTHSIYVRLEGTSLRLSRPRYNVRKRAMWNEPHYEPSFIHQRHFDIRSATVSLLPEGLARKRLWSKKYPICLVIPDAFGITQPKIEVAKDCLSSLDASPAETPLSSDEPSPINGTVDKVVLYLFARTDREKEEWFRRFEVAPARQQIAQTNEMNRSWSLDTCDGNQTLPRSMSVSLGVQSSASFPPLPKESKSIDFNEYMSLLLPPCVPTHKIASQKASQDKPTLLRNVSSLTCISEEVTNSVSWLNALIGRLFFDFLTQPCWSEAVANKIQRKLSKIKVPYFIEELTLTDIHLGSALPQICKTYEPGMDERGLWIDLDIMYSGTFQMTLETKLNLMRLGKKQTIEMIEFSANEQEVEPITTVSRSHVYNSEEEDSAESSSDEDLNSIDPESAEESNVGSSAGKRILRFVDKISQSRCFQQVTEYKYVKKAMEGVSNTPIMLTVEVRNLVGTLALNIPPPPTDRLWYGFRGNPKLTISARPKLGEHVVTLSPVTEWIEKKLLLEFQKLLVIPNMDDLPIPVMNSGLSRS